MSDTSQGDGWWQASDGKWYGPDERPETNAMPPPPSQASPIEETATPAVRIGRGGRRNVPRSAGFRNRAVIIAALSPAEDEGVTRQRSHQRRLRRVSGASGHHDDRDTCHNDDDRCCTGGVRCLGRHVPDGCRSVMRSCLRADPRGSNESERIGVARTHLRYRSKQQRSVR